MHGADVDKGDKQVEARKAANEASHEADKKSGQEQETSVLGGQTDSFESDTGRDEAARQDESQGEHGQSLPQATNWIRAITHSTLLP